MDDHIFVFQHWCSLQPCLRRFADRFGTQPWVVLAAGSICLAGILRGITAEMVSTAVGHLYPMFASFRALEDGGPAGDCWLLYWITYGAVLLAEMVLSGLLRWIPLYPALRLCFIAWLFWRDAAGAKLVYGWAVAPALRLYRPRIEALLECGGAAAECAAPAVPPHGAAADAVDSTGDEPAEAAGGARPSVQRPVVEDIVRNAAAPLRRGGSQRRVQSPAPCVSAAIRAAASGLQMAAAALDHK